MNNVRWSNLKYMARSPLHYKHALEHPPVETAAMRIGGCVHKALLGGPHEYICFPGDRRGKEWTLFREAHDDVTILNASEFALAEGAVDAILASPLAGDYLTGTREIRQHWEIAGRGCSGTPDVYGDGTVTELKVTKDASPYRFPFHARRSLWDAQLSWYAHGLGYDRPALRIVAVEMKPPHAVAVYAMTSTAIELAEKKWRSLFERLLVCEASGDWPGYCESVLPLDGDEDVTLTIDGEEVVL